MSTDLVFARFSKHQAIVLQEKTFVRDQTRTLS